MAEELKLYTGNLRYKNIDFTFVFDKTELRMIPPKDKEYEIEWEDELMCAAFWWDIAAPGAKDGNPAGEEDPEQCNVFNDR